MKEKWVRFLDYLIEFSLYILIIQIPISKAGVEISACLLIAAFCLKKILCPDFRFLAKPVNFFLYGFIALNCLSLFNSGPYFKKSLIALLFKWGEYFMVFFAIEGSLLNYKKIRRAAYLLLAVSIVIGIDGLYQYFTGVDFIRGRGLMYVLNNTPAIRASLEHYNDFAGYLLIVLFLALALFISKQARLYKANFFLLTVLLASCLLLTYSRGAWIGFIFALFLMLFVSKDLKRLLPVFFIFLISLISSPFLRERLAFIFKKGGDQNRFILWDTTYSMIKENLFLGKGVGTFMDYFFQRGRGLSPQYAHNCFLQIWAETGIFSLLSFLAFMASLIARGIIVFKKSNNYLLLGMLCGLSGFLTHSFFDTHFYSLQLSALFWSTAGIAAALINLPLTIYRGHPFPLGSRADSDPPRRRGEGSH